MNPCLALAKKFGSTSVRKGLTNHFHRCELWSIGRKIASSIGKRSLVTESKDDSAKRIEDEEEKQSWESELSKINLLQERITVLEKDANGYIRKIEESKEKLLRSLAENENLRQKHKKDLEVARIYSISGFARNLLEVADSLSRALSSVDLEDSDRNSLKSFYNGISITSSNLNKIFEAHGVTKIQSLGKQFDPREHEAILEVKDPSKPKGQICEELQPGYKIHDRILRAAKVATIKN
ncbi:putative GrpE protein [Cryptosporidium felis]|nr:putative GrpE protein [Cryptosporidium felis]